MSIRSDSGWSTRYLGRACAFRADGLARLQQVLQRNAVNVPDRAASDERLRGMGGLLRPRHANVTRNRFTGSGAV